MEIAQMRSHEIFRQRLASSAAYNRAFLFIAATYAMTFPYTVAGNPTTPDRATAITVAEAQYRVFADSPDEKILAGDLYEVSVPVERVYHLFWSTVVLSVGP
jgi:hypothetical protein